MAARRRLLPYPACAGGQGRPGRGAAPAAGACGPSPQPFSAPAPWDRTFPLTSPGSVQCLEPSTDPEGNLRNPENPFGPYPTHASNADAQPSPFSPAFHPLPCLCHKRLSTPSFPSSSLTAHLPPLRQPSSLPRFPQSLHHPPLALPHTHTLPGSFHPLFVPLLLLPPNPVPFNAIPLTLPHGLMFSIQPHPPGLLPLNIPLPLHAHTLLAASCPRSPSLRFKREVPSV